MEVETLIIIYTIKCEVRKCESAKTGNV